MNNQPTIGEAGGIERRCVNDKNLAIFFLYKTYYCIYVILDVEGMFQGELHHAPLITLPSFLNSVGMGDRGKVFSPKITIFSHRL